MDHGVTNCDIRGSLYIFNFGIAKMEAEAGKFFCDIISTVVIIIF